MSYQSIEFIIFVLLVLLFYYTVGRKHQKLVLAVANLVFYAVAGLKYLPFMLITMVATFAAGKKMGAIYADADEQLKLCADNAEKKVVRAKAKKDAKRVLQLSMFITLIFLIVCKYSLFAVSNVNAVLAHFGAAQIPMFRMVLPLGISFYSFMALSYVLDIYWKRYKAEQNFINYAVYLAYFPHVVQGPIDRFNEFSKQLEQPVALDYKTITYGAQLALWGFFQKLVIADRLGILVDTVLADWASYTGGMLFFIIVVFSVQIYADFSGCIDIVTGVSEMLGIKLRKNFNHPYFSRTMAEFWRRWHISLQEWFKDYVYYPVSASAFMKKLKKSSKEKFGLRTSELAASCFPIFVVWCVTGIWHGAAWKFVLWGMFHAALLIGSQIFAPLFKKVPEVLKLNTETYGFRFFQIMRTFILCCIGRIFFRSDDFAMSVGIISKVIHNTNLPSITQTIEILGAVDVLVVVFAIILLLAVDIIQEKTSVRDLLAKENYITRWIVFFAILFIIILTGIYGPGYNASSFIYEQF
ncbi:MAG: MBOAT family protein [Ruminococcaceae bacterium]|nr:MBOAT family protein [Oscillospiraceae bacterium]